MADSKRQKIVDAIVARMATILTANGYDTDLGTLVEDWRIHWQDEDLGSTGAISVCDLPAEAAPTEGRANPQNTIWLMPVQIRFQFRRTDTIAELVRKGIRDINAAIRTDDRWTVSNVGLAMITRPSKEGPLIPEDSFEIVGGVVEFEVQYITQKFNAEA